MTDPQHPQSAPATSTDELDPTPHASEGLTSDSLIEEVSIDGMCGVY